MEIKADSTLKTGSVLDEKYVVLECIGKGGMGEVYRAHQLNLNRDVAIKVLSSEWMQSCVDNELEKESGLQRFRREVQAMARVRHAHILQIYDFASGTVQEDKSRRRIEYIAMEYIPGNTLRATMSEQGFHPEEDLARRWVRRYLIPVLQGVRALHRAEIVHRDLKPENVLMDDEVPKIADFGLVRSCRLPAVTKSYDVKGTLPYMSPEHYYDFGRADRRADIYSLGKILYEAMEGKIGSQHLPFKQVSLKEPQTRFFKEIDRIIRSATEEEPRNRLQSADEFSDLLDAALALDEDQTDADAAPAEQQRISGSASARRRPLKIGLIAALVLLLLVAGYALSVLLNPPKVSETGRVPTETAGETPALAPVAGDEVTMPLIPGGSVDLPAGVLGDSAQTLTVDNFFLDETQVTNHQFVQFLNQSLASIRVENRVVKHGNDVWLYLGEVFQDYEPIVFRSGRFALTHSGHAACPVLRVTALGAEAYAAGVGKRLPTVAEWYYALVKGKPASSPVGNTGRAQTAGSMEGMHQQMHGGPDVPASSTGREEMPSIQKEANSVPEPVLSFTPNALGIRGLNAEVGEWSQYTGQWGLNAPDELGYVMLEATGGKLPRPVVRQPWEADAKVGFRCARDGGS